MILKNNFTPETRLLYLDRYDCDRCGCNQMLELHHNTGRTSPSPLNASLLCHNCHEHVYQNDRKLFIKNIKFLLSVGYKITPEDIDFIKKNPRLIRDNAELKQWLNN